MSVSRAADNTTLAPINEPLSPAGREAAEQAQQAASTILDNIAQLSQIQLRNAVCGEAAASLTGDVVNMASQRGTLRPPGLGFFCG